MSITFTGQDGTETYRAIAIKHGLIMYQQIGMKPNRAWTPSAMLKAAGRITGKAYRRRQYSEAIADLAAWIETNGTTGEHHETR